jgi:hypothetical protein
VRNLAGFRGPFGSADWFSGQSAPAGQDDGVRLPVLVRRPIRVRFMPPTCKPTVPLTLV